MTIPAFRPSPRLPHAPVEPKSLYLLPAGIVAGEAAAAAVVAGTGWPLAGGPLAFTAAGLVWREGGVAWIATVPFPELVDWAEAQSDEVARHVSRLVHRIGAKRKPWAGFALDRPLVMGIVNTTPDSFSDGGDNFDPAVAIASGLAMAEAGADIVDVGGESTRPGAAEVSPAEELRRVIPVVRALAERGVCVSIDTRNAPVMEAAVAAGARIINDISALEGEGALAAAARTGAALCLMHMQGEPRTMQAEPRYDCAPLDIFDYLAGRIAACEAAGIPAERIASDPGIGFGKTLDHNLQTLGALALLHGLGCPVLLGVSRKSFIARASCGEEPKARLPGTLAANLAGLDQGVQIVRVHDVPETLQAVAVWRGMHNRA
ncbi:MAG: dihydropteroate synthase [Solirubrobacterales bacterium]